MTATTSRPAVSATPATNLTRDDAPIIMALRIVIVILALTSEVWNIVNMIRDGERATEHFAYFTIHSNLLVLFVFGWMLLQPERQRPGWFDGLRAAAVMYMVMTGLVYMLLVAPPGEMWSWDIAYTGLAQHRLLPWLVAIDWLLVPTVKKIRWSTIGWLMIYPIVYLICAQLRGLIDQWYPYPFMDPIEQGGYANLLWPTGQVVIAFILGATVIVAVARFRWDLTQGDAAPERETEAETEDA